MQHGASSYYYFPYLRNTLIIEQPLLDFSYVIAYANTSLYIQNNCRILVFHHVGACVYTRVVGYEKRQWVE